MRQSELIRCKATTRRGKRCKNGAVDSTGYCRLHHPSPQQRPSTGSSFERDCATVLRLLGYSVEPDVTVHGCQIDLLAVYRTGVIPLRLMVECKEHAQPIGISDVKAFAGTLNAARGVAVDKGLLISTHGFTRDAREFAEQAGIQLTRFIDLATQLVSFDDYLDRVVADYESLGIARYYIDLSASETEDYDVEDASQLQRPLDDVVNRHLYASDESKLAILGNFGTGKSTFCRKYAHDAAKQCKADPNARLPVVVSLSDYESRLDIQELITNTLQFRYGIRIDLALCLELQRLGRFVFLFDGFDEMATRVDPDVVRDNLHEINKISRIQKNKFILTCRTHFFRDRVQAEVLADFYLLYIPEWGDRELSEYLEKRLGLDWRRHLERIHGTHNLAELAQTPLFTEMIVETLPALGDEVRRAELYRTYTGKWISEQSRRRGARLDSVERAAFVRALARKMYSEDRSSCHYSEFTEFIQQRFDISDAAQIDYLQSDVRTCTFLTRNADGYYGFRHRSFMEFFVAESVANDICNGKRDLIVGKVLPLEIRRFVSDLLRSNPPAAIMEEWLRQSADSALRDNCLAIAASLGLSVGSKALRTAGAEAAEDERAARFLEGDKAAFDEVAVALAPELVADMMHRFSIDRTIAEDVVFETLFRIWQDRDRIDQVSNLRGYAFRTATHVFMDYRRLQWRRPVGVPLGATGDLADPSSERRDEPELSTAEIEGALAKLSERDQRLVRGRVMEQRSYAALAKELGMAVSAVRSRTYRAIQKLRQLLRERA